MPICSSRRALRHYTNLQLDDEDRIALHETCDLLQHQKLHYRTQTRPDRRLRQLPESFFRVAQRMSNPTSHNPRMKMKFFPPFNDGGEVVAAWGQAQLIKYLDGKLELKGGSKEDRIAAHEWMSLFWHEAVVVDGSGRRL